MAARKPKEIPGDDGRTVVDMNVDGMPWYVPREKADPEGDNGTYEFADRKNDVQLIKAIEVMDELLH